MNNYSLILPNLFIFRTNPQKPGIKKTKILFNRGSSRHQEKVSNIIFNKLCNVFQGIHLRKKNSVNIWR